VPGRATSKTPLPFFKIDYYDTKNAFGETKIKRNETPLQKR
jgi:hypothetical protein